MAKQRDLVETTIFGHLASFVPSGEIKAKELIDENTFEELKQHIPVKSYETLTDLKYQLDDKFSYAEIRLVLQELEKN